VLSKLAFSARTKKDNVPALEGVPVRRAVPVPGTKARDKSDRKSGEKMLVIGTLLVKYVAARKKFALGSIGMPLKKFPSVGVSNKTVSLKANVIA
jgi:hypothetical protein